jgi:hypothetical protein
LAGHARWLAEHLRLAPRRRGRARRVDQAWIRRAGGARRVICVGLSKQAGTADAADDRQHPAADDHCLLY